MSLSSSSRKLRFSRGVSDILLSRIVSRIIDGMETAEDARTRPDLVFLLSAFYVDRLNSTESSSSGGP